MKLKPRHYRSYYSNNTTIGRGRMKMFWYWIHTQTFIYDDKAERWFKNKLPILSCEIRLGTIHLKGVAGRKLHDFSPVTHCLCAWEYVHSRLLQQTSLRFSKSLPDRFPQVLRRIQINFQKSYRINTTIGLIKIKWVDFDRKSAVNQWHNVNVFRKSLYRYLIVKWIIFSFHHSDN